MKATQHQLWYRDARNLDTLEDESINLVVTSPPYPMIEMWDETFTALNAKIGEALDAGDYHTTFELMHLELDKVWQELYRVLKPGGFACINIGDATRTIGGKFQLFSNHSRILQSFWRKGFDTLPLIIWRKQTNAPNKFMGSGMLPAGAYVTLEHEYILIFRKGSKRVFKNTQEKQNRKESALFWEERNRWYSDLWDFKGIRQNIASLNGSKNSSKANINSNLRGRSGAFPFLLPYRLINMYSVYDDTVLDPFLGTGTTTLAAMACGRNSVGYEIDHNFTSFLEEKIEAPDLLTELNSYHRDRIREHQEFVKHVTEEKGQPPKHFNKYLEFPIVTKQEVSLKIVPVKEINREGEGNYKVTYGSFEDLLYNNINNNQYNIVNNSKEVPQYQHRLF